MSLRASSGKTQYWGLTIQKGPWKETSQDKRNEMTSLGSKTFFGGGVQGAGKIHAGHAGAFSAMDPVKTPSWGNHPAPMPGPSRYAQRSITLSREPSQFMQQLPPRHFYEPHRAAVAPGTAPGVGPRGRPIGSSIRDNNQAPVVEQNDNDGTDDLMAETEPEAGMSGSTQQPTYVPPQPPLPQMPGGFVQEDLSSSNYDKEHDVTAAEFAAINHFLNNKSDPASIGPAAAPENFGNQKPPGKNNGSQTQHRVGKPMETQTQDQFDDAVDITEHINALYNENEELKLEIHKNLGYIQYADQTSKNILASLGVDPDLLTQKLTPELLLAIAEDTRQLTPELMNELNALRHSRSIIEIPQAYERDLIKQAMEREAIMKAMREKSSKFSFKSPYFAPRALKRGIDDTDFVQGVPRYRRRTNEDKSVFSRDLEDMSNAITAKENAKSLKDRFVRPGGSLPSLRKRINLPAPKRPTLKLPAPTNKMNLSAPKKGKMSYADAVKGKGKGKTGGVTWP